MGRLQARPGHDLLGVDLGRSLPCILILDNRDAQIRRLVAGCGAGAFWDRHQGRTPNTPALQALDIGVRVAQAAEALAAIEVRLFSAHVQHDDGLARFCVGSLHESDQLQFADTARLRHGLGTVGDVGFAKGV